MADAISITPIHRIVVKTAPVKHPHITVTEPPRDIGPRRLPAAPTHELRIEKAKPRVAMLLNCFLISVPD